MSNNTKELEEKIEKLGYQLANNVYDTIKTLQFTLDLTERYYENSHSRFVGDMSGKMAKLMNLNEEDIFEISTAGLLHDIGKIGFRDTALFKTMSEMNSREMKQYKLHVDIGRELLHYHKAMHGVADIVYEHHENFDGTGFPEKKQKNQIKIGARIINIVDFYHNAMHKSLKLEYMSDISQKSNAMDYLQENQRKFDNILEYMEDQKNIKFDPELVHLFIKLAESERKKIEGFLVKRIHITNVKPGMIFAESYYSSSGLLIANKGEVVANDSLKALYRCVESDQIPQKLLMLADNND
jgi:putative nucleotidyltransferase with HDIG domain